MYLVVVTIGSPLVRRADLRDSGIRRSRFPALDGGVGGFSLFFGGSDYQRPVSGCQRSASGRLALVA